MLHALEVMNRAPLCVPSATSVADLARLLLDKGADGACVVDDGELVGVVTSMDLVFQDRQVHLPTFITFLDAMVPVGTKRAMREMEKISGTTVADIMSSEVKSVSFDDGLDEIASLMVDKHITLVPVVRDGKLIGVITKKDVLRAHYGRKP